MKKLLWIMLAALPIQADANDDNPVAYKCYYCTPDEMEDVARAQGVGRHYVYDAQNLTINGYDVSKRNESLYAQSFSTEDWIEAQFLGMMSLYKPDGGEMFAFIEGVDLFAPGTEHGRGSAYLWGQDLTALNPHHAQARESVRRFLNGRKEFSFLDTSVSGGKLLKFDYMQDGTRPIRAFMTFAGNLQSSSNYYFDHNARLWRYSSSSMPIGSSREPIQERREDFAPLNGITLFQYLASQSSSIDSFIERAAWADIPVHGQLPTYGFARFRCVRSGEDIECSIE